jgi:hypothetical protein
MWGQISSTTGASKIFRRQVVSFFALAITLIAWSSWPGRAEPFLSGKPAPDISGGPWLNSKPLAINDLKGRVVLVEFWTYG